MLHSSTWHPLRAEPRRPVPYVGDNLDRLLGLLEAARADQAVRGRAGREAPYRALATLIARGPVGVERNCA